MINITGTELDCWQEFEPNFDLGSEKLDQTNSNLTAGEENKPFNLQESVSFVHSHISSATSLMFLWNIEF